MNKLTCKIRRIWYNKYIKMINVFYNDYRMSKRLFSFRQADFIGFCIIKFQKI